MPSNLILDASGNLYGTTSSGGANGDGAVFELVLGKSGYAAPKLVANLTAAMGGGSISALLLDSAGNLIGTTLKGGANGDGSVFELAKQASGYGAPIVLAAFNGANGAEPGLTQVADGSGDLFGTTLVGGAHNDGTVFELVKTATGYAAPTVLASFNGTNGQLPIAGVTFDALGNLYGTAVEGGTGSAGVVYELARTAGGYGPIVDLTNFDSADGANPVGGVYFAGNGVLLGDTSDGIGISANGNLFELTAPTGGMVTVSVTDTPAKAALQQAAVQLGAGAGVSTLALPARNAAAAIELAVRA